MGTQETRRANLQRLADSSSISEIAKRTGRPISQICDVLYERKAFGEKLARRMESELSLPPGSLDMQESEATSVSLVRSEGTFRVPVVSWSTAASQTPDTEGIIISEKDRPQAFALRIMDQSMAPTFAPGDVVVFERNATPTPGKYVLAEMEGVVMFRRYRQTGLASFELVPENTDFPLVKSTDGNVRVVAVMVESRKYW